MLSRSGTGATPTWVINIPSPPTKRALAHAVEKVSVLVTENIPSLFLDSFLFLSKIWTGKQRGKMGCYVLSREATTAWTVCGLHQVYTSAHKGRVIFEIGVHPRRYIKRLAFTLVDKEVLL